MMLEEACLASIGPRSLKSKLALLRDQKKLLTNTRFVQGSVFVATGQRPRVAWLRPAIVAMLAVRRIQGMAGVLTMRFPVRAGEGNSEEAPI
jgi:hypothetical protein